LKQVDNVQKSMRNLNWLYISLCSLNDKKKQWLSFRFIEITSQAMAQLFKRKHLRINIADLMIWKPFLEWVFFYRGVYCILQILFIQDQRKIVSHTIMIFRLPRVRSNDLRKVLLDKYFVVLIILYNARDPKLRIEA